jgi:AraC-like DNA-binding protein
MRKTPKTMTTKALQRILELRRQNKTIIEISQATGYSTSVIWDYCAAHGMRSVRNYVPSETIQRVVRLYEVAEMSIEMIADVTHVSASTINRILRRYSTVRRKGHPSPVLRRQQMEHRRKVWSLFHEHGTRKTAEMLGVTMSCVYYHTKKYLSETAL